MHMNALKRVARGERTTMIVIVLVAAVALVLGVGGFFMARTFLTSADSGTTASKASSDSNGGMSGDSSSSPSETSQAPDTAPQFRKDSSYCRFVGIALQTHKLALYKFSDITLS